MSTIDDVGQLLRRLELRVTPQRRAILNAFRGAPDEHLSAEEVLFRASAVVPDIGRGTVYSTLAELTELGLLSSVGHPEPVRYEINLAPHDHFRCRLCQRTFDVELGGAQLRARQLDGCTIDALYVRAEGVCSHCHDYQRGIADGAAAVIERPTLHASALAELTCLQIESPLGALSAAASSEGVVRVAFSDHADFDAMAERARARRGSAAGRARLKEVGKTLSDYFDGGREVASEEIDWRMTTPGGREVLLAVQQIPYAAPLSYDRVAGEMSAYDCGSLIGANPLPLLIPCHRVGCGSLQVDSYVGGVDRLRRLLDFESS